MLKERCTDTTKQMSRHTSSLTARARLGAEEEGDGYCTKRGDFFP
jgi:hypothetical protein